MRKLSGLVLVGALLLPVGLARAADVDNFLTNNLFATSFLNDEAGNSTGVFVTRQKGKGEPVDSIFVIISGPTSFSFVGGTLPKGALSIGKKSASVDVAVSEIAVTSSSGDIPADAVISVNWDAGDVTTTTGNTIFEFGTTRVHIHGHSTSAAATISGTVFGAPFGAAQGNINTVHDEVQILVTN
jgi:hypothetical protein